MLRVSTILEREGKLFKEFSSIVNCSFVLLWTDAENKRNLYL